MQTLQLDQVADHTVWDFCRRHGFAVVTKDEDYNALSILQGQPPKAIWLQLGNCTTAEVETALLARRAEIDAFEQDPSVGTFVISRTQPGA